MRKQYSILAAPLRRIVGQIDWAIDEHRPKAPGDGVDLWLQKSVLECGHIVSHPKHGPLETRRRARCVDCLDGLPPSVDVSHGTQSARGDAR